MNESLLRALEKQYPMACSYAEDARYNWPERWRALKRAIKGTKIPKHQLLEMNPGDNFRANGYAFKCIVTDDEFVYAEKTGKVQS